MCCFSFKKITKCCTVQKSIDFEFVYFEKYFQGQFFLCRVSSVLFFFPENISSRKEGLLYVVSRSSPSGSVLFYRCSSTFAMLK